MEIVPPKGCIAVNENGAWRGRSNPGDSLETVARLFCERKGKTIVEIGTGLHGKGAGNSILSWVDQTNAQSIYAVDVSQKRIDQVDEAVGTDSRVTTVLGDGIDFLRDFRSTIDLLYLDFWTPDPKGTIQGTGRAEAYREAFLAAKSSFSGNSLILIDDTDHVDPWKQTHIVPLARASGFEVAYVGRQTLLIQTG